MYLLPDENILADYDNTVGIVTGARARAPSMDASVYTEYLDKEVPVLMSRPPIGAHGTGRTQRLFCQASLAAHFGGTGRITCSICSILRCSAMTAFDLDYSCTAPSVCVRSPRRYLPADPRLQQEPPEQQTLLPGNCWECRVRAQYPRESGETRVNCTAAN